MSFSDFTELSVWKKAFDLLLDIYLLTRAFPGDEKFGMVSDMRRAGNSVVHNVAEGFGRFEKKDKSRFYKISRGSSYELISQILVSHALGYLNDLKKENLIVGYKDVIKELDMIIKTVETR